MTQPFTAAPHHDILVLLVQIAVLLLTARLLGEIAQRLNQSAVVGEILAGVLLGPSVLSSLIPPLGEWIVPQTPIQGYLLEVISLLGVMFLLIVTGLEIDIPLIRSQIRSAFGVAIGGLLLPLAIGIAFGQFLPDGLLVESEQRFVVVLLLATVIAISSIPIVTKVLLDLNLTRRDMGQTIIAVAMIDDTVAWIILSVVAGLVGGSAVTAGSVLQSIFRVFAFFIISFTAGRWLVRRIFDYAQNNLRMRDMALSFVVLCMFIFAAIAQLMGLEALLGAFVTGMIFSQIRSLGAETIHRIEGFALGIFAPLFFAVAGLKVNILNLLTPELLTLTLVIIGVAVIAKALGVYLGARFIGGANHWTAFFYGSGLNARGSMGIIAATIGLSLGILTQDMFSIIVTMALVTSLLAPIPQRWAIQYIQPGNLEAQRLRREQLVAESLIPNIHRVLLPVRPRTKEGAAQLIEAHILQKLSAKNDLSTTLFTVDTEQHRNEAMAFLNHLSETFRFGAVNKKFVAGEKVRQAILDETAKSYDLLMLGTPEGKTSSQTLFNPILDDLIRLSSAPTLLVHGEIVPTDWNPRCILVPVNGSLSSRRATELAYAIATDEHDEVFLLWVVEEQQDEYQSAGHEMLLSRQEQVAQITLSQLTEMTSSPNLTIHTRILVSTNPEKVILDFIVNHDIDLLIIGTSIGIAAEQLYMGPKVERLIYNAACPVIVLNP